MIVVDSLHMLHSANHDHEPWRSGRPALPVGPLSLPAASPPGRVPLAQVPQHRAAWLLAAKAAVFGAVTLIVGEAASFISFFPDGATLRHGIVAPTLGQPGVLRAIVVTGPASA